MRIINKEAKNKNQEEKTMNDNQIRNALEEVYVILQNTEESLVSKIPHQLMQFIEENRNPQFETNIRSDIPLDKQNLLKETEAILTLIDKSYFEKES